MNLLLLFVFLTQPVQLADTIWVTLSKCGHPLWTVTCELVNWFTLHLQIGRDMQYLKLLKCHYFQMFTGKHSSAAFIRLDPAAFAELNKIWSDLQNRFQQELDQSWCVRVFYLQNTLQISEIKFSALTYFLCNTTNVIRIAWRVSQPKN